MQKFIIKEKQNISGGILKSSLILERELIILYQVDSVLVV